MIAAADPEMDEPARDRERAARELSGRGVLRFDAVSGRAGVRVHDATRIPAHVALIGRDVELSDGPGAERRALDRPAVIRCLVPVLEDNVRFGRFLRLLVFLRRERQEGESACAYQLVPAVARQRAAVKADRVLQSARQCDVQRLRCLVFQRELQDHRRQARIVRVERQKRRIRFQRHCYRDGWVLVSDDADWILPAKPHRRKAGAVQWTDVIADLQGEPLLNRRYRRHRLCIVLGARAERLIENVPVPKPSVAAKIQLPGAEPADRHADESEVFALVDR